MISVCVRRPHTSRVTLSWRLMTACVPWVGGLHGGLARSARTREVAAALGSDREDAECGRDSESSRGRFVWDLGVVGSQDQPTRAPGVPAPPVAVAV